MYSIKNNHYKNFTDFTKVIIELYGNEFFENNKNTYLRNFRSKTFNEI